MNDRERPTFAEIGNRIANPPQLAPVTGRPRDPRQVWESIEATDHLLNSPVSASPKIATNDAVEAMYRAMTAGAALPVAENEPWRGLVDQAVQMHDLYFGSAPDREKAEPWESGPRTVEEYEAGWNSADAPLGFESDRLPITHDNHDEFGEVLPPWNPTTEADVAVIVSTSRPGHRWLVRGTTTVETVSDEVYFNDNHCDLSYACCTRNATSLRNKVFAFAHGDLIVLGMICASCWTQWCERQLPEPPEDVIHETDMEE